MEHSHNRSSYLQYKHNTSILIRWIVTTASSCTPEVAVPKPRNNNPKQKKRIQAKARTAALKLNSPEVTLNSLICLSKIIAEAQKAIPSAIFALFDSVIRARTAAHACFEQLWLEHPDVDLKESNESHSAFIHALKESRDLLSGETGRSKLSDAVSSDQSRKSPQKPAHPAEPLEFANRFAMLNIESLAHEDEAQLEHIALNPSADSSVTPESGKTTSKGKSKRHVEPLENYKIQSENEVYFAVCFFIRDLLEMRRYCRDVWKDVGLGKVNCATAGAISNLAVAMVKTAEYELGSDYPACFYYQGVTNNLIGKGNYEALRAKSTKTSVEYREEIQQSLLLDCHDDLVTFITDYRKKRNGRPGPSLKKINWDCNFVWETANPASRRKWVADYTISWLFDLVNTYASTRIQDVDQDSSLKDAEKLDWSCENLKTLRNGWSRRRLWGPIEFARDITILAMQKVGSPVQENIKPHHVFQLQLIIDSMLTASRWSVTAHLDPPADLPPEARLSFAWQESNPLVDLFGTARRYVRSANGLNELLERVKADTVCPKNAMTAPVFNLKRMADEVLTSCAQTILTIGGTSAQPALPKSMFFRSSPNGLWMYSPYLCGTAEVDLLNESYRWGTLWWDRLLYVTPFLHLYNMLLECGHIRKPIYLFESIIDIFMEDVFRSGRPRLGDGMDRKGGFCNAFSVGIGTKASFSANVLTKRRVQGGRLKEETESFLTHRGKWWKCDHFRNASKLFALEEADWVREKVDIGKFPSLKKAGGHECDALDFLRAVQVDLEADFAAKIPVPLLDFNMVLITVIALLTEIDGQTQDLAVADRQAYMEHCVAKGRYGLHDKVLALAFGEMPVMLQDMTGQRLDSPLLRRMGSVIEKTWDEIDPMQVVLLRGSVK